MHLTTILRTRVEHWRNERLTRPVFEARRQRKWRAFCRFIHRRSPYYAEVMDQHGLDPQTCQPEDFPVLTKATVIERFDDLVTDRRLTDAKVRAFLERSHDPRAPARQMASLLTGPVTRAISRPSRAISPAFST